MNWALLLIALATAAVFVALPFIRQDLRRTMHQLHQEAVETLTREEAAAEGLAQQLHDIESQLIRIHARANRLQGGTGARSLQLTQSGVDHIHPSGREHRRGRGHGPGPPH